MKSPLKFAFEGRFFKYTFWNSLDTDKIKRNPWIRLEMRLAV